MQAYGSRDVFFHIFVVFDRYHEAIGRTVLR